MPGKKRKPRSGAASAKNKTASIDETEVESTGNKDDHDAAETAAAPAKRPKVYSRYYPVYRLVHIKVLTVLLHFSGNCKFFSSA